MNETETKKPSSRALLYSMILFALAILTGSGFALFMAIAMAFMGMVLEPLILSMDNEESDDE